MSPVRRFLRFEQLEDRRLLAVFTVNTTLDTVAVDANVSAFDAAGHVSLRSAIQRTNALAGVDTIDLPAGTYTLTRAGANEDLAATGDLDITADLTITGAGAAATIIDASGIPGRDRVLDILGILTVEISDLTVSGGSLPDTPDFVYGGGIWNRQSALTLLRTTVRNNQLDTTNNTGFGGGVSNGFYDSNNLAVGGSLTLLNSTIRDNQADAYGGGIDNLGSASISYSIISANRAGNGGGIYHAGYGPQAEPLLLTVLSSTISNNVADVLYGGGIYSDSLLEVSGSAITGNTARESGGGLFNDATATLVNTTVSGNQSFHFDVVATTNSGGGIDNVGTVSLLNCNIVNNRAVVQVGDIQFPGFGGGIFNFVGNVSLTNTIVSHNVGRHNFENCFTIGVALISGGHNLDSDGSCGLAGAGDLSGVDPLLGPLANNGGFTQTHALLPGSPAIDAGDNASSTATDQRGRARPADGDGNSLAIVDIGPFEYLGAPIEVVVDGATTQAFLDELMFVSGDLILDATARPDLMLPLLVLVDGDVIIVGNTAATDISMPGLGGAGGNLTIADNTAATTIVMPNLGGTGGDLTIADNTALTTIVMPNLGGTGGNLTIADNTALTDINMPGLGSTGGSMSIVDNSAVAVISMDSLGGTGTSMTITDNSALTVISMDSLGGTGTSMTITENPALTVISMDSLVGTGTSMTITDNSALTAISMDSLAGTGTSMTITENPALTVISMDSLAGTGTSMTITENPALTVISMDSLVGTGTSMTITENPALAVISMPGLTDVAGDLTAEAMNSVAAVTADGATELTLATAEASLTAVLQMGTFASPVAFTVSRFEPVALDPEAGEDASGAAATIDPLFAYQFSFDIPTLGMQATLSFEIDVAALAPAEQTALLEALAGGQLTVAVKNDAPGSVYQAFALAAPGQPPSADVVAVTLLDANHNPLPPGSLAVPAFVVFTGVTGHFSTFAVVIAKTVALAGDYNANGVVDAADYTVWRDALGRMVAPYAGADGDGSGQVDQADYGLWKANFGNTLPIPGAGSGAFEQEANGQAGAVTALAEPVALLGDDSDALAVKQQVSIAEGTTVQGSSGTLSQGRKAEEGRGSAEFPDPRISILATPSARQADRVFQEWGPRRAGNLLAVRVYQTQVAESAAADSGTTVRRGGLPHVVETDTVCETIDAALDSLLTKSTRLAWTLPNLAEIG